ncbi:DNA-binding protein [Alcanivorax sp. S71-1-4]|uniref:helix-turn-helix domain-containing protein n=1 Tax=Alcanivorax sp. S71-1-4 TaxID=1177159 RepID=UPI001358F346|nr:helix-turn-helix transcriptional regulator [Alcanivorax sp. S71-1-4]KAF0806803.1 DNA-binding protein [Alcanivorax sp. S71-1-4]
MNAHTDVQVINGPDGKPAFVVIPYQDYVSTHPREDLIPHEVAGYVLVDELSPAAAWRRHLGLTQAEVAERIGITQAAYAQQEKARRPRAGTRARIASALGISPDMLDIN